MFTAPGFYSSANMAGGVGGKSDTKVAWQVFIDLLEKKAGHSPVVTSSEILHSEWPLQGHFYTA